MAYLPPFEYDVFISYARVDDQKAPGKDKGWVSLFHEYLDIELSKRFGRVGDIKIWRDTREIRGNTYFDEAIQTSIENSGLFLALTSRGYFATECYCAKELKWFHEKVQADGHGMKIGTRSRLFNLLLYNIPRKEWPAEYSGTGGLAFHDSERVDQRGQPSRQDSVLFDQQLRQLVDEVETTLRDFKNVLDPKSEKKGEPEPAGDSSRVFLAHTEGSLRVIRMRVIEELQSKGVQVVTNIPPPYQAKLHEQRVTAEMRKADLSVHLLDGAPGMEIEDEPGKSFFQAQIELGQQHARSQLIWLPKTFELQSVDDLGYREFLDRLENGSREQVKYNFIKESPGSISREILEKINQIKMQQVPNHATPSAALLDTHFKDQLYALDLGKFLLEQLKMQPYINPEEDTPQKNLTLFQEMLKRVSVLIIVFGEVAGDWVRERLTSALHIATAEKCNLKLCGIYLAPINGKGAARQVSLGVFPTSIPIFLFDSRETLANLLNRFVGS